MKKKFVSLLVFLVFILSCAIHNVTDTVGTAALGFEGFRGVEWGATLEQMQSEMVFAGKNTDKKIEWYTRKDEDLSIGKARVESIHYVFYQDLFRRVSMVARGADNYEALRDYLLAKYGEAATSVEGAYTWNLEMTQIMFGYNPSTEVGLLIIQKNAQN